jgi:hypothetical protein
MSLRQVIQTVQHNYGRDGFPRPEPESGMAGREGRPPAWVLEPGWFERISLDSRADLVAQTLNPDIDLDNNGDGGYFVIEGDVGAVPSLPDADKVSRWGADVLAYYLPFHFYNSRWGVYIRDHGVLHLATELKGSRLGPQDAPLLDTAYGVLLQHERFHFITEVACSKAEIAAQKSLYSGYFVQGIPSMHEEGLCNAYALRRGPAHGAKHHKPDVARWMKGQRPGYHDFDRYSTPPAFEIGEALAGAFMIGTTPPWPADILFRGVRGEILPIYRICDVDLPWLDRLKPFPKKYGLRVEVHTREHPPPHIHIECPPGKDKTRYEWPTLKPLKGDPWLSNAEAEKF